MAVQFNEAISNVVELVRCLAELSTKVSHRATAPRTASTRPHSPPRPPRVQISDAFKQGARSTVPELLARGRPLGKALDAAVTDLVNRAMQDLGLNHRRTLHAGDVHVGAPPSDDRIKECVPLPHSPCLSTSPSPRTPCL